jgi:hypothetical protein
MNKDYSKGYRPRGFSISIKDRAAFPTEVLVPITGTTFTIEPWIVKKQEILEWAKKTKVAAKFVDNWDDLFNPINMRDCNTNLLGQTYEVLSYQVWEVPEDGDRAMFILRWL